MRNLTDSQRVVLLHAAQRDDGAASLTEKLKGGAAIKVAKALIARKLLREVKAKPGMPVWRRDREGRPFSLVISSAGRKAIGATEKDVESATNVGDPARSSPSAISTGHPSKRISRRRNCNSSRSRAGSRCRRVFGSQCARRHEEGAFDRDVEPPGRSFDRCSHGCNRMASPYHPCGADWIAPCRPCHRAVQERQWSFGLSVAARSRISRERQCCIGSARHGSRSDMTVMANRTNGRTAIASDTPDPVAFEAKSLQQEIVQLRDLDLDGLRLHWRNLFGRAAPTHLPKFLLLRIVAYRMQANVYGDLGKNARRTLDRLAQRRAGEDGSETATRLSQSDPQSLRAGTQFLREWGGVMHRVTVVDDGFIWNGRDVSEFIKGRPCDHWNSLERSALFRNARQAIPIGSQAPSCAIAPRRRGGHEAHTIRRKGRAGRHGSPLCDLHARVDRSWIGTGLQLARRPARSV